MLSVKQELLAALAGELETLSPGAGARAAFESPKVAAHGDFACTAAMQLAKPLKLNPRALGEQLKAALEATPAFQRWVDAIEIAGPGFLNIRLKPAAKQQIIREVLGQAEKFGWQADRGAKMLVEFVSGMSATGAIMGSYEQTQRLLAARCTWAMAARPRWAMPSATSMPPRAGACTASSTTTTRACRSTR